MYNLDSTAPIDPPGPLPDLTGEFSPAPVAAAAARRSLYVPLRLKFALVLVLAAAWMGFSVWLSQSWLDELSQVTGFAVALLVIAFVAYVPGFMNAFLIGSILSDRRPSRREFATYPDLCVLVACYNEAENIDDTLLSLARQDYAGQVEVVVIDDGSTDDSLAIAQAAGGRR